MDLLLDVVSDTVRLIPFLFVTYLLLTYAEHKDEVGFHRLIRRYQYLGPALGAVLGIFPQCGFSAQSVQVLRAVGADFAHVNILEDPEMRQELKIYSNWPTFPQLYVGG